MWNVESGTPSSFREVRIQNSEVREAMGAKNSTRNETANPASVVANLDRGCGQLLDPLPQFGGPQLQILKVVSGCENEARDNQTTKVQHETIGQAHDGHVTERATGRTQKSDDLIFPGLARQFDQVFQR